MVHGRAAWIHGRCRCQRCRQAIRDYAKVQRAAAALTRGADPATRVNPARARRRIAELRAAGWTIARIAHAAGLSHTTVDRITYRYTKRCSRITAAAILAILP